MNLLKRLVGPFFLFLIGIPSWAQITQIEGNAPEFIGEEIRLFRYTDLHSKNLVQEDSTRVDSNGQFLLEMPLEGIRYVKITVDHVAAHLYVQEDSQYQIEFPLPPKGKSRTFAREAKTNVFFNNLDIDDINSDIIDFNFNYELFFSKNQNLLRRLFSPGNAAQADSLKKEGPRATGHPSARLFHLLDDFASQMDSIYEDGDRPYFKQYRDAVLGQLMLNGPVSRRDIYERFMQPNRPNIHHPEMAAFHEKFFKHYWQTNSSSFGEQALDSAINVLGDFERLRLLMSRDDFVIDSERKELVLCIALREVWKGRTNHPVAQKLYQHLAKEGHTEDIRLLATMLDRRLNANQKGMPFAKLSFENQFNERQNITQFRGKPLLIAFTSLKCSSCQEERQLFEEIVEEFYEDVQFLEIILRDEQGLPIEHFGEDYATRAEYDMLSPIIQELNILRLPHYILIDEKGLVLDEHCRMPSEGLRSQLQRIKSATDKKPTRPRIGGKEN